MLVCVGVDGVGRRGRQGRTRRGEMLAAASVPMSKFGFRDESLIAALTGADEL